MNIYAAITGVMSEIGAIAKDRKNVQQGFLYRGIDDVMNVLQPLLIKYKIFIVPEVLEHAREDRTTKNGGNLIYSIMKIKYTFWAEDGSNVSALVIGEGMDSGDKASNKAMAIGMKYVCFQVFCIPTEEMVDPDKETHSIAAMVKMTTPPKATTSPSKEGTASDPNLISEAQRKRMFAMSHNNTDLCKSITAKYGYTSSKDIKKADYEKICSEIEAEVGK